MPDLKTAFTTATDATSDADITINDVSVESKTGSSVQGPGISLETLALEVPFEQLYEKDRRIASGSFGTVYTCRNLKNQNVYAVKVIDRSDLKKTDDDAVFREVKILRKVRGTPNIMELVDFFVATATLHVVMEYAAGGDVFGRLARRKSYTEEDARQLAKVLLRTVAALHEKRIVHRDLKPENLLLQNIYDDSSILLADFGFAREVKPEGCQTRCGTPAFVAPEILTGQAYGCSCDLWSVGCILYMLLGGYPPFAGKHHRDLFRKIRSADFVFYSNQWENVSIHAKQLIAQLLTVKVENRWTAAQALEESEWFRSTPQHLSMNDLSSSLTRLQSFRARRSWKAAMSAIGWATSAKFWNPDAVSFGQQMEMWDQQLRLTGSSSRRSLMTNSSGPSRFHDLYDIGPQLRKGASATVWKCISRRTKQTLAVKIIDRTKATSSDDDEAVLNEVAIMQSLTGNKYVVQLLDFYEEPDAFYLVMEYMEGGDVFDQIVARTHYTERNARDLISRLLKAVHSIHETGIAQRDLKPQNLMLLSRDDSHVETMKLGDFGFARRVHTPSSLVSRVGTPTYVAPEILKNIPHDERVDLWSIGIIAFVMLVGYPPFLEDKQSDLFHKIRTCEWGFVKEDWENISMEAKDFIRGLLVNDPKDRWTVEEALRSQWINQDPDHLSSNDLAESLKGMRLQRNRLRGLARSVMFLGIRRDISVVEVPTQAQDDPMDLSP